MMTPTRSFISSLLVLCILSSIYATTDAYVYLESTERFARDIGESSERFARDVGGSDGDSSSDSGSGETPSPTTTAPTPFPTLSPTILSPTPAPTAPIVIELLFEGNLEDLTEEDQVEFKDVVKTEVRAEFPDILAEHITVTLVAGSIKAIVTISPESSFNDPAEAQKVQDTLNYETPLTVTLSSGTTFSQVVVTTTVEPTEGVKDEDKSLSDAEVAGIVIAVLVALVLILVVGKSYLEKSPEAVYSNQQSRPQPANGSESGIQLNRLNGGYSTVSMLAADKDSIRITSI